ncbi:MAG: TonB-dependent receptor [Parasphingopyxis sp.]|uniref:TonB-dependent receptor n=1 Tax=Parasphingopyxis sp. TaxID=1920299 RepID=UPI0032EADD50
MLNRPGGAQGPGGFTVPFALDTDDVTNYEFGWKTQLFNRDLRFNGSIFYVEIERFQTTIFDPSITNLFFSDNAADAEIWGIEGDIAWRPYSLPGLTIAGAFSILDTEITDVLTPTNDVLVGSELAFAPGFQGNMRLRYEWDFAPGFTAHIMPQITHSASSFTDIIEINKIPARQLDDAGSFGRRGDGRLVDRGVCRQSDQRTGRNQRDLRQRPGAHDGEPAADCRYALLGRLLGYLRREWWTGRFAIPAQSPY